MLRCLEALSFDKLAPKTKSLGQLSDPGLNWRLMFPFFLCRDSTATPLTRGGTFLTLRRCCTTRGSWQQHMPKHFRYGQRSSFPEQLYRALRQGSKELADEQKPDLGEQGLFPDSRVCSVCVF